MSENVPAPEYTESEQSPSTVGSPESGFATAVAASDPSMGPRVGAPRVPPGGPLDRVRSTFVTSPTLDQSVVSNTISVAFSVAGFRPREPSRAVAFFATCRVTVGAGTQPDCQRNAAWLVSRPFAPRTSTIVSA